jgi:alanine racemase
MLCWIEIDAAAVRHNYRIFCALAGKERVAPVIKGNAYGHGMSEVYHALASESPPWLCVCYVSEAEQLRSLGYGGRILVVGAAVPRELARAAQCGAEMVVGNADVLAAWQAAPAKCKIHVKLDTGMSRQGFLPEEAGAVAARLAADKALVAGVCTHFANVEDVTEHEYADLQLARFQAAAAVFRAAGLTVLEHAASSAACLILDEARLDLERVGISLYGVWPSQVTRVSYLQLHQKLVELRPVLSWRTEVTTVKPVRSGQFIGYGCTYRAIRDMCVAVLPVGYYEGYPRIAGEQASYVLVRGRRCPIVGRICMNMMMVDVSHVEGVTVGETATLIGTDGAETIPAHEVAGWAKTIHYELLSRLHHDIPRRLIEA